MACGFCFFLTPQTRSEKPWQWRSPPHCAKLRRLLNNDRFPPQLAGQRLRIFCSMAGPQMASLAPLSHLTTDPAQTWPLGCLSRTLCLSVIYDSGFEPVSFSLTNWNPDLSRLNSYIFEILSDPPQCNCLAILGKENYIICFLNIGNLLLTPPVPQPFSVQNLEFGN